MGLKAYIYVALSFTSGIYALSINTPASAVECQPLALSWSNGTAPYYLAVIPGGDTSTALENLPTQSSASSYTWTCDVASGTSIGFRVTDSTGLIAYTDSLTVQSGSDSSCVGSSSNSSDSSADTSSSVASSSSGSASAAVLSSSSAVSSMKASTAQSASSSSSSETTSAAGSNNAATTSASSTATTALSSSFVMTVAISSAFIVILTL